MKQKKILNLSAFCVGIFLCALIIGCAPSTQISQSPTKKNLNFVKVLIHKTNDYVVIQSKGNVQISDLQNRKIVYRGNAKKLVFSADKVDKILSISSEGGPLFINGKPFRGTIILVKRNNCLNVINRLKMNEYLYGVVPSEMMASWPSDALKAQAVCARTYTYYHLLTTHNMFFDLDGTTAFQVYKGMSVETAASNLAVDKTKGEVLTWQGKPILAFFHSTCGGHTADNKNVWVKGENLPYLRPVKCSACQDSIYYNWTESLSLAEIENALKKKYPNIGSIKSLTLKKINSRVVFIDIKHSNGLQRVSGNEFRLLISPKKIRSTYFSIKKEPAGMLLIGHGWGHGVGMCQYGAKGYALQGKNYRWILNHYFPGARMSRLRKF